MKRLRRFKEVISTEKELKESSLFGKGVAISQNRIHAATKTKYISSLSQIQNDCRQGIREDDARKRSDVQFQILFDLAASLKLLADMSTANNNIGATAVLDAENIQKTIDTAFAKLFK
jgi:hypothetical protein